MNRTDPAFLLARLKVLNDSFDSDPASSFGEKDIHKTLKYYIDKDKSHHEIRLGEFIVDVMNENGIFEIQTRAFERLVPKLEKLLGKNQVTVVYPIIKEKKLYWLDTEELESRPPHKVPRKGKLSDALPEISKLERFIGNENFVLRIYVITADEHRFLDGYGKDKKRRATKFSIYPTDILETYELKSAEDYRILMPENLPERFTAKEFSSALQMKGRRAFFSLSFCMKMGFINRVGKQGNAYLYEKNATPEKE